MKRRKFIPGLLVASGMLFGGFLVNPASFAGGAVILVPAEDRDVPEGSQIPEWRIEKTEKMVSEYKKKMKGKQQDRLPQNSPSQKPPNNGN